MKGNAWVEQSDAADSIELENVRALVTAVEDSRCHGHCHEGGCPLAAAYAEQAGRIAAALRDIVGNSVPDEWLVRNAHAMTRPPLLTTVRVNTLLCTASAVQFQVNATLREQGMSNSASALYASLPEMLCVPADGPHSWTPAERRMVVSAECARAVLRGACVFAPGVLGLEDGHAQTVSVWADLEGRCTRGLRTRYAGPVLPVGNARLVMARESIFVASPSGTAAAPLAATWRMPSLDGVHGARLYAQNLPSALAVAALDVRPGMRVLDMCAAPGGKATHVCARLGAAGLLVAVERARGRAQRLAETILACGSRCAIVLHGDATRLRVDERGCLVCPGASVLAPLVTDGASGDIGSIGDEERIAVSPPQVGGSDARTGTEGTHAIGKESSLPFKLSPSSEGTTKFDRIVLDAPCSGVGQRPLVLRRGETLAARGYAEYQRRLVSVASGLLSPGGALVYATCTLNPEENEAVVSHALRAHGLVLGLRPDERLRGVPGHGLDAAQLLRVRRFWPAGPHDSIAFFYAVLVKPA